MTTTIHLSGPAEVLAVLPYQLGFHPRRSLVAVSLLGTRLGLVQRIDLPATRHLCDAVGAMMAPLQKDNPASVLLIGFEERAGESRAMLDEMATACETGGVEVTERIVVRGGRWFVPDCHKRCCPPEGRALPAPGEVAAVAEFVGRGIFPLQDRSALADQLKPTGPPLAGELSSCANKWLARRRVAQRTGEEGLDECRATELAIWARALGTEDDLESIRALPTRDLAMLGVSLTDVDLRDALIAWLCPGTLALELVDPVLLSLMREALGEQPWRQGQAWDLDQVFALQRIERRLCEVCASLSDPWAVPALTVLATFTWWRGEGALTRVALDRALGIDPLYRLARLLEQMVNLAIRPGRALA
ncbi:MAG: DUF4192 domain-containing protein [Actinomycetota bacterium]